MPNSILTESLLFAKFLRIFFMKKYWILTNYSSASLEMSFKILFFGDFLGGPKHLHKCPYKREVQGDLMQTKGKVATWLERDWNDVATGLGLSVHHQKLQEARKGFSPRILVAEILLWWQPHTKEAFITMSKKSLLFLTTKFVEMLQQLQKTNTVDLE